MIKNKPIIPILIGFITIFLLVLAVKGDRGNPIYFQSELDGRLGGPFESTGSNSRYALTWAIVEQRTIFFDIGLARFAAPDLVKYHGKYFSAFLPGVSFLGVPFYWLGKLIGLPQLITYSLTMVLALINAALVAKIARKFGVDTLTSWLSGLIFLFATNALAYALTFTQHQASLTLILLAVINAMGGRTLWKNVGLGLILGMGLLIDIPNVIILSPLVMYVLMKHLDIMHVGERVKLSLQFIGFGIVIGILPLVLLLGWYNYQTTGSPTLIAQLIGRSNYPPPANPLPKKPVDKPESIYEQKLVLNSRNLWQGFYILLVSNERGIFYYSPILVLGCLGWYLAFKNGRARGLTLTILGMILITVLNYAMFLDPWGGWAFGPRYLIPVSALLSIFIGFSVNRYKTNPLFVCLFLVLLTYSLWVNILGALTTNEIPPQVEAVNLITPIPYTYEYNLQLLQKNFSSSLIFNLFLINKLPAKIFFYIYVGVALALTSGLYLLVIFDKRLKRAST